MRTMFIPASRNRSSDARTSSLPAFIDTTSGGSRTAGIVGGSELARLSG